MLTINPFIQAVKTAATTTKPEWATRLAGYSVGEGRLRSRCREFIRPIRNDH